MQRLVQAFLALCVVAGILYFIATSAHSLLTRGDLTEFLDHGAAANQFLRSLRGS